MLIPLSWVNDFCQLPKLSYSQIAQRFTLSSCEVEGVLCDRKLWNQVVIAKITAIDKHPEADSLYLPTINVGSRQLSLVCGADNLYVGMRTLWAAEGTCFTDPKSGEDWTLKSKEIRGVLSEGMLCSEYELGISHNHDGIIDLKHPFLQEHSCEGMPFNQFLSEVLEYGQDLEQLFPQRKGLIKPEFILEIDNKSLTHRPDMWGVYGMAREFACVFQEELKKPFNPKWLAQEQAKFTAEPSPFSPLVEGDSACLAYATLCLDGAQVGQSPDWLQQRLQLAGLNSINNIVDISNYAMLELGIPNHIFDREQLTGKQLHIKRLGGEQDFTTLDENSHKLLPSDTVICDEQGPQVLAGIMGGLHSSVRESSTKLLIEVAVWKAHEIHKTSVRLGLRSDSSLRYEKSLDPLQVERSLLRIAELLQKVCPSSKICGKAEIHYAEGQDPAEHKDLQIHTTASKISTVLGYSISADEVQQIFERLEFRVNRAADGDSMEVLIPSFRTTKDIEREEDLIEEVGRIIGYDNIEAASPLTQIQPLGLSPMIKAKRQIRDFLKYAAQAQEVMSYPLVGKKLLETCKWPEDASALALLNPLSPEQDRMRPSLIPSLLDLAQKNRSSAFAKDYRIFEIGRSYHGSTLKNATSGPCEKEILALAYIHHKENPIIQLRRDCEGLFAALKLKGTWQMDDSGQLSILPEWNGIHPHQRMFWRCEQKLIKGEIFSLHPKLLTELKLRGKVCIAYFEIDQLAQAPHYKLRAQMPSKFPRMEFDCTVVLEEKVFAAAAVEAIHRAAKRDQSTAGQKFQRLLQDIRVRGVFEPEGSKQRWLTLQSVFADPQNTLNGQEIKELEDLVVEYLRQEGFQLKS